MRSNHHLVVVGLGGIGSWLLRGLCPYLSSPPAPVAGAGGEAESPHTPPELVLVDGDAYTPGNGGRQLFHRMGNKAEVCAEGVNGGFDLLAHAVPAYLGEHTTSDGPHPAVAIEEVILDGDGVFLCVDNHASRRLVFEYAETLRDVEVFSGGNDYDDGNVMVYVRKDGRDLTPNPLSYHDDIRTGRDRRPDQMSCDELAASGTPQLLVANMLAASLMLAAYHSRKTGAFNLKYPEVFFDVPKLLVAGRPRAVKKAEHAQPAVP